MDAAGETAVRVLTSAQMREADQRTMRTEPIAPVDLMERAGRAAAAAIARHVGGWQGRSVLVLCGKGHNGGDGCVIARVASASGARVRVALAAPVTACAPDTQTMAARLSGASATVLDASTQESLAALRDECLAADVIVDALVGTGLRAPLSGHLAGLVHAINEAGARGVPVAAVDVPSGLDADATAEIGPTVTASVTLTLAAPKPALVQPPSDRHVGVLDVVDIGIPRPILDGVPGPRLDWVTREDAAALLPLRDREAHKGSCGHVLIVAGSVGRTGAAALAAKAALRSGAGLVTVATPASCWPVVAGLGAEYMTKPLADEGGASSARAVDEVLDVRCDVVAAGPGLGVTAWAAAIIEGLVHQTPGPLVLDADALTLLATRLPLLQARRSRGTVLTPHPGEMARLTGRSVAEIQRDRLAVARDFATTHGVTLVLKGHRTVVASPDGELAVNSTGNAGMATGGTGDVLTGVIAAWCAQCGSVPRAAVLGVYLHGLAGDLARDRMGEIALIASDVVDGLGPAALALASNE